MGAKSPGSTLQQSPHPRRPLRRAGAGPTPPHPRQPWLSRTALGHGAVSQASGPASPPGSPPAPTQGKASGAAPTLLSQKGPGCLPVQTRQVVRTTL